MMDSGLTISPLSSHRLTCTLAQAYKRMMGGDGWVGRDKPSSNRIASESEG